MPWHHRCCASATPDGLPSPTASSGVQNWKQIRRYHFFMMRRQITVIVLMMALMEILRVGPTELLYAGRNGYPPPGKDDYGISYNVGYFLNWLYLCAFNIVYVPLFSWWVPDTPSDPENPSTIMKIGEYLAKFDRVLLPIAIALSLARHFYHTIMALIYVDSQSIGSRKIPKNSRKNWIARLMLLCGIILSLSLGYGAFQILESVDLAHVKRLEYAIIVVPVQINFGVIFGTIMQFKMEARMAMKEAKKLENAELEQAVDTEKVSLLEA